MAYKGPNEMIGPGSSTDNALVRWDGTSGFIGQDSGAILSDADALSGLTQLDVDNLRLDGNTLSSTDTNGNIIFDPDGTGNISLVDPGSIVPTGDRTQDIGSITNSFQNFYVNGISFDDGSNFLDFYEEGTWTPTLEFGGATTGITYSDRSGQYTRIGNVVYIRARITLSNKGTATGNNGIITLPFPIASNNLQNGTLLADNLTFGGNYLIFNFSNTTPSADGMTIVQINSGGGNTTLTDTAFANNTDIRLNGFYFTT